MKTKSFKLLSISALVILLMGVILITCSDKDPVQPTNSAPNAPSSPSPPDGSVSRPLTQQLGWSCSDPDGDPLNYDVYLGTTSPPTIKVDSSLTSRAFDPGTLAFSTTYYWKIVVRDNHSHTRSGPEWSFTTGDNGPPTQPSSPSPTSGATDQAITTQVSWAASTDPEVDPVTYDVYFGTVSPPPQIATSHQSTTYDPPGTLSFGQLYYWSITAKDDHSNETPGPIWNFTTTSNQAPTAPSSPSPNDGASSQSIDPVLSWAASTDPESDPVTYDVYFGTTVTPPIVNSNQPGTTYDPGTLDLSRTYYWQVRARDDQSNVTPGPVWDFTTRMGTWSTMTSGTSSDLNAVWGPSSNDVYALGLLAITRYNGSTWTDLPDAFIDEWDGYCAWGTSSNNVFAGGSGRNLTTPVGFIFNFDGSSWSQALAQTGSFATIADMWAASSNDVFAVGWWDANYRYNGTSWTHFTIIDPGTETFQAQGVWGTSASNVYAVGALTFGGPGKIYRYNGSTWSEVHATAAGVGLPDIWGTASNNIWAVGESGTILRFNGSSWSTVSSPTGENINGIWGNRADDIFAVANGGVVLHYDGTSWTIMTDPTSENLNGIWGTSGKDIFAAGDNGTIIHYAP